MKTKKRPPTAHAVLFGLQKATRLITRQDRVISDLRKKIDRLNIRVSELGTCVRRMRLGKSSLSSLGRPLTIDVGKRMRILKKIICQHLELPPHALDRRTGNKIPFPWARQLFMYFAVKYKLGSHVRIVDAISLTNHSTVTPAKATVINRCTHERHAHKQCEAIDADIRRQFDALSATGTGAR